MSPGQNHSGTTAFFLAMSMILLLNPHARAATGRAGTAAADFLKMGVGARYLAMGEAATAVADDANAIFWNPANLARLRRSSLSFMYGASVEPFQYHAAAYGQPAGALGSFGLAFQTLSVGQIQQTNDMAQTLGDFTPRDLAGTLSWGRTFFNQLSSFLPPVDAGVNFKFIQSKIIKSASTVAGDVGASVRTELFTYGAAIQNIGGKLKFEQEGDPLPLMVRLGLAYKIAPTWVWSLDGSMPKGGNAALSTGTEYFWSFRNGTALALRGGFNSRSQAPGLLGLSAGMGFRLPILTIDYAWTSLGDLGQTHRVSMTIPFGKPVSAEPAKQEAKAPVEKPAKENKKETKQTKPAAETKAVAVSTAPATPPQPTEKILHNGDVVKLPPALAEIAAQKDAGVTFVLHSSFNAGKSTLNSSARSTLNELAKLFKEYPKNKVLVEGHTNSLGNPEYNRILSLERALSVANYFIENDDFPTDHFRVKGLAASQPIAPNSTEQGRQANARVEITLLYEKP